MADIEDRPRAAGEATGRARSAKRAGYGSRLVQRLMKLPTPLTRDVVVQRNLRVPMPDGTVLLADRWAPRKGGDGLPTALIRTPYGRRGPMVALSAPPLAERGFQVIVQSTRGTFGSEGDFDPFRREREDGLATLDWLLKQPWCGDTIVLTGGSYHGYTQWAVADRLPAQDKAMIPVVTESALTLDFLREDGFSLETPFGWGVMVAGQERRGAMLRQMLDARKTHRAQFTLPLGEADVAALGRRSQYLQDILVHGADDAHWSAADHRARVAEVSVPVSTVGGWYDLFLPGQLRDYAALRAAGREARLTVGPWTHTAMGVFAQAAAQTLEFGLAHAHGEQPPERAPVRLYVTGEEKWRDFASWPPTGYAPQRFRLQADGALSPKKPGESAPDGYCYDPADPTPALGGVRFSPGDAGSTSAVLLDVRDDHVEGEAQPSIDRLAIAVHRELTSASVLGADRSFLGDYTAEHIAAVGDGGTPWTVTLGTPTVRTIDATAHLVHPLEIRPPDGRVTDFDLRYDVIVEELVTHRVIATVRYDLDRGILRTDDAETLGVLDRDTTSLNVPAGQGSWLRGFVTTVGLGTEHVGEGADHLLFLLMLLVPAPLVAAGGRWRAAGASRRRAVVRVVHVVSAFATGHSLTLALAAAGAIHVPSRPVETLIAFSIAVSAVHATRLLVARGEVLIAGGFGLVHGLAFASLIGDLGLDRGSLVTTLLGFNLGIELTQLLVAVSLAVLAVVALHLAPRTSSTGRLT